MTSLVWARAGENISPIHSTGRLVSDDRTKNRTSVSAARATPPAHASLSGRSSARGSTATSRSLLTCCSPPPEGRKKSSRYCGRRRPRPRRGSGRCPRRGPSRRRAPLLIPDLAALGEFPRGVAVLHRVVRRLLEALVRARRVLLGNNDVTLGISRPTLYDLLNRFGLKEMQR